MTTDHIKTLFQHLLEVNISCHVSRINTSCILLRVKASMPRCGSPIPRTPKLRARLQMNGRPMFFFGLSFSEFYRLGRHEKLFLGPPFTAATNSPNPRRPHPNTHSKLSSRTTPTKLNLLGLEITYRRGTANRSPKGRHSPNTIIIPLNFRSGLLCIIDPPQ